MSLLKTLAILVCIYFVCCNVIYRVSTLQVISNVEDECTNKRFLYIKVI